MLRLILTSLIFIFSILGVDMVSAACENADTSTPASFIRNCSEDSEGRAVLRDVRDTAGVKALVIEIAERVIQFGALFAIGAIVFSGIRYTTSAGDDEKIKSAKNTAIFAIVGLVLLLIAFPLVDIVVGFFYDLG